MAAAYEELDGSGWCRAIVLASEGRHFCAGLDFAGNAGQDIAALYRAALRLFAAPLPVVAAVQGAAIGGGCGLALSADFRVATAQSRFSANFARLGFHHGFALTVTLPAAVGRQAAADLLLTGRRVGGEEALALGLCDRLAGDGDLLAQAIALRGRAGRVGAARRPRPSGPRCAAAWSRRPAWPWSTSARSRPGCATRPTSPRACAPRRSDATRRSAGQ